MENKYFYFLLGCIVVAGIYGALTASKKIFFVQALPALIALAFSLSTKGLNWIMS